MASTPNTSASMKTAATFNGAPDLKYFRDRYPLTVANFGSLGEREAYLRRIWQTEMRWQETMESQQQTAREAVVHGAPPAGLAVEGEFEIIYAGGVLGLLHAAVLGTRFKRRVLVFDAGAIGPSDSSSSSSSGSSNRGWNISDEELGEFERAGLFTKDEIEATVVNRYRSGFVKFHDAASRVKTPPLWMEKVLDVSIDADKLLGMAAAKLRARVAEGCALVENLRFVRAYVEQDRVCVETEDTHGHSSGRRRLFAARLFVDALGLQHSPVARQFNEGRAFTHVAPSVGTVARGFVRGEGADRVDFNVGEILVSTEDARDHRQLIWEGFAGAPARDEYATRLFFYDAVDSPADKSLLALFERYFEELPRYKRAGAQWRVERPLFGYAPGVHPRGWKTRSYSTADDRVMLVGDAGAGLGGGDGGGPFTFSGFGSCARHLRRLTHLTDLALAADLLDRRALSEINAPAPRVAQMSGFAEFLRPAPQSEPANVNETLNAVMAALHDLDVRVRRELFQDRMSFSALKSLLSRTAKLYPRIFQRVREHLGTRGAFWWFANIAEAAFSERRARRAAIGRETLNEETGQEEEAAPPAEEFARYLARYRKEDGAGV